MPGGQHLTVKNPQMQPEALLNDRWWWTMALSAPLWLSSNCNDGVIKRRKIAQNKISVRTIIIPVSRQCIVSMLSVTWTIRRDVPLPVLKGTLQTRFYLLSIPPGRCKSQTVHVGGVRLCGVLVRNAMVIFQTVGASLMKVDVLRSTMRHLILMNDVKSTSVHPVPFFDVVLILKCLCFNSLFQEITEVTAIFQTVRHFWQMTLPLDLLTLVQVVVYLWSWKDFSFNLLFQDFSKD